MMILLGLIVIMEMIIMKMKIYIGINEDKLHGLQKSKIVIFHQYIVEAMQ